MAFGYREREEPRRPGIWRAGPAMSVALLAVALGASLLTGLVGLRLDGAARIAANLALIILPLATWWMAYYRPAQRAGRALPHMPALILLGALLANGLALPIIHEGYEVDAWLPRASGLTRIIGYTLIVGFLQEYLKFAAVRYTVFPDALHERGDGVAYGVTVALGFATTLSLRFFVDGGSAPLGPGAVRVISITLSQIAFGAVNGYFLSGARFARKEPPAWWFTLGLLVTALLNGLYLALRGGLIVGTFGVGSTANSPLLGLALVGALALGTFSVLGFLNGQAEAREAAMPGGRVFR
jgi:RsiW-degrading membrane proteinase PrsW (M82 family)